MTKISLKNFQAHDDTVLDLKGNFVALLGSTNSGKSSVVRALRWLFFDGIRGKRFIRNGQKFATVSVEFSDGKVSRTKSPTENSFSANGTKMTAVGVGVPPEVSNASNIRPAILDESTELELNVAQQMSSPFLLMEPDSFKAKALNVLTGASVFDAAIRQTQKNLRDLESAKKSAEETIQRTEKDLLAFADLDEQERKLKELEALIVRFEQVSAMIVTLNEAKQVLATNQAQAVKLRGEVVGLDQWIPVFERAIFVEGQLNELRLYSTLKTNREALGKELRDTEKKLEECKSSILSLPDVPCQMCGQPITKKVRESMLV